MISKKKDESGGAFPATIGYVSGGIIANANIYIDEGNLGFDYAYPEVDVTIQLKDGYLINISEGTMNKIEKMGKRIEQMTTEEFEDRLMVLEI